VCRGQVDGRLLVLSLDDGRHWAEGLLLEHRHVVGDTRQDRRSEEPAAALEAVAAQQDASALGHRLLDLPLQGVAKVGPGQRPHSGRWVERVANRQRGGGVHQPLLELLCHRAFNDEPLGRDAALASVREPGSGRLLGHVRQVGIGEDDERVGAA
jgi:hypothetical protein